MNKVLQMEKLGQPRCFCLPACFCHLKDNSCRIGTSLVPVQGSVFMERCWLSIVALWSLGGGNLDSPSSGYRFSAFWLRSKCSICSYQLNIWYGRHVLPSILNWFLQGDRVQELALRLCHGLAWYCSTTRIGPLNPTHSLELPCVWCNWACFLLTFNDQGQILVEHLGLGSWFLQRVLLIF